MIVKNLNKTTDNDSCNCNSWIEHWLKFSFISRLIPRKCCCLNFRGTDIIGEHVKKILSKGDNWYIAPICRSCNVKHGQWLFISNDIPLARANVNDTCGK